MDGDRKGRSARADCRPALPVQERFTRGIWSVAMPAVLNGRQLATMMPSLYRDSQPRSLVQSPDEISVTMLTSAGGEIHSFASSAHLLGVVLRGAGHHAQWHDNRQVHAGPLQAGTVNIVPAGTTPRSVGTRVEVLHFYLPHADLRGRAASMGRHGGDRDLEIVSPLFARDNAIVSLSQCFTDVIDAPDAVSRMYRESLIEAVVARILQRWSNVGCLRELEHKSGLAPWQLARACDMMQANLCSPLSLDALAKAVGLSSSHFSRAFKRTTGLAPSQWLALQRIEESKHLLAGNRLSLAEVALAVGFSAQSAFTTAFRRSTGLSPGAWRRRRLV